MGGGAAFVEGGDARAEGSVFFERIDVDLTAAVVGAEEEAIGAIEGEVGVAVLQFEGIVAVIVAGGIECDEGAGGRIGFGIVGGDVEEGFFGMGDDGGGGETEIDFIDEGEGETVILGGDAFNDEQFAGVTRGDVDVEGVGGVGEGEC